MINAAKINHGPIIQPKLVIYVATAQSLDNIEMKKCMQKKINQFLNPLFKIHDVIFVKDLPKTASNKIMRRVLRESSKYPN